MLDRELVLHEKFQDRISSRSDCRKLDVVVEVHQEASIGLETQPQLFDQFSRLLGNNTVSRDYDWD